MQIFSQNGVSEKTNYLVRQAQEKAMSGDHRTAVEYLKALSWLS